MAWEKGFVLDHGFSEAKRTRVNCRDCIHYIVEDYSCSIKPYYFPEDGYNKWKSCDHFDLSNGAYNYDKKNAKTVHTVKEFEDEEDIIYIKAYHTIPGGKDIRLTMDGVFLEYRDCILGAHLDRRNDIDKLANTIPEKAYRGFWDYLKEDKKALFKAAIVEWIKRLGMIPYNRAVSRIVRKSRYLLCSVKKMGWNEINKKNMYDCVIKSFCDEIYGENIEMKPEL